LIHLVHAHGELCLPEELLLLLLLLEARSTIIETSSHGSSIMVEAVVLEGLTTIVEIIIGILVDSRGVRTGREAWDIERTTRCSGVRHDGPRGRSDTTGSESREKRCTVVRLSHDSYW